MKVQPRGPRPGGPILVALALALALPLAGCGEESDARFLRRSVELTNLPEPILKAARKKLPGVEFAEAWSNNLPGKDEIHSYEVRGKAANGKTREVRVSPDGTILEVE